MTNYASELAELAAGVAARYPDDEDAQRVAEYAKQVVVDHPDPRPHHIPSSTPVGARVLPIIWPEGAGGDGGVVTETTPASRESDHVEISWQGSAGECSEYVGDVVLDTLHNRQWLRGHTHWAWAAPGEPPAPLDTLVMVSELREGDHVDLERDPFADPTGDNPSLGCLYAVVASIERETTDCIVVHFDEHDSVGFPVDHHVVYHPNEDR